MPEKIRIDDLANPRLTDMQKAALAYGNEHRVDLTVDAVLGSAAAATGLDDFGPDDFHERLGLWLSEMDADDERTGLGRLGFFGECVRYASTRLRIRDLLARHPEILEIPIERPVIVVGLPRSGTTHLVNLLAADQRFRSMPLWESYEPVPDSRESVGPGGIDPRWQRCEDAWQAMQISMPLIAAMHPMNPDHVHEDLELMLPDFTSYNIEWISRSPRWRDHLLSHDQTEHYRSMKVGLQILQWFKPRERWVLKCPQHLEQLGPLMTVFPDATVVVTHRDPVSVVQSTVTMVTYGARMGYRSPRPEWYLEYWSDRIRRLLDSSVRDRHLLPAGRTVDVLFHEFMADDMGIVRNIYETAGLELTTEAKGQLDAYIATHPRGKDGQVVYDLRSDFDITPAEVRQAFDFYMDRFAVQVEVS
ncbi:MAG: sulfotransferase [Actinobacteria bacterium]|uniref:Unannotated protein n=1 Tax=freshwater metagenome TaxID=449393 RepID=A0A6J6V0W6_9ZZZZ|nr:sulfotransferase [Actinomycetota bacterium]MSW92060.1 sulfotransferase [Actinomycetota bacterium]MSX88418.1 sulfotransferase [Actinomycetota bacterium]MSY72984.1 sulfotransferase [Actinomycetota bacterium]